jgi:hypothetical protein
MIEKLKERFSLVRIFVADDATRRTWDDWEAVAKATGFDGETSLGFGRGKTAADFVAAMEISRFVASSEPNIVIAAASEGGAWNLAIDHARDSGRSVAIVADEGKEIDGVRSAEELVLVREPSEEERERAIRLAKAAHLDRLRDENGPWTMLDGVLESVTDVPGGAIATFRDPDGGRRNLLEPTPPPGCLPRLSRSHVGRRHVVIVPENGADEREAVPILVHRVQKRTHPENVAARHDGAVIVSIEPDSETAPSKRISGRLRLSAEGPEIPFRRRYEAKGNSELFRVGAKLDVVGDVDDDGAFLLRYAVPSAMTEKTTNADEGKTVNQAKVKTTDAPDSKNAEPPSFLRRAITRLSDLSSAILGKKHGDQAKKEEGKALASCALFIDGDQNAPWQLSSILSEVGKSVRVDSLFVAANSSRKDWDAWANVADASGFRGRIAVRFGEGKNAADIFAAMEIARIVEAKEPFDAIAVATADGDWQHAIDHAKAHGKKAVIVRTHGKGLRARKNDIECLVPDPNDDRRDELVLMAHVASMRNDLVSLTGTVEREPEETETEFKFEVRTQTGELVRARIAKNGPPNETGGLSALTERSVRQTELPEKGAKVLVCGVAAEDGSVVALHSRTLFQAEKKMIPKRHDAVEIVTASKERDGIVSGTFRLVTDGPEIPFVMEAAITAERLVPGGKFDVVVTPGGKERNGKRKPVTVRFVRMTKTAEDERTNAIPTTRKKDEQR